MDYKKEYNDMVQRARELHESGNALTKMQMEIVCPQLAESEDERIRKEIIAFLQSMNGHCNPTQDWDLRNRWLPYLEKQKEQKPVNFYVPEGIDMNDPKSKIAFILGIYSEQTGMPQEEYLSLLKFLGEQHPANSEEPKEWSEEDEKILKDCIDMPYSADFISIERKKDAIRWLKSLPERFNLQPKQEWSEEDLDKMVNARARKSGTTKSEMEFYRHGIKDTLKSSLRPQPHWKPSEEQINALQAFVGMIHPDARYNEVLSLLDELKAL